MIEQISAKRKNTSNYKNGQQSLSINTSSQLKLKQITAQSTQLPNYWTPNQQSGNNFRKFEEDIFRQKKVQSSRPLYTSQDNGLNIVNTQQFYNSEFQYDDDKINTSQFQSHDEDQQGSSSKKSFIHHNRSAKSPSETIKLLEKQIKNLKMMNEYFQISLKQKDSIYKAMVLENIKLKHQIQLLEQQNNSKNLQTSETNLLFKTQKNLLVDQGHKPFQSLHITNTQQSTKIQQLFEQLNKQIQINRI